MKPIEPGCRCWVIPGHSNEATKIGARAFGRECTAIEFLGDIHRRTFSIERAWRIQVDDGEKFNVAESCLVRIDPNADFLAEEAQRRTDEERSVKA